MGTFRVTIEIGDPAGLYWLPVEALADTGVSYTWIPRGLLERLGVVSHARWEFEIAGGTVIQREVAETRVRLNGETITTIVVFGDEGSTPLLGAYTLEGFRLAPDPVNRRLIRVRGLVMAVAPGPAPEAVP